MMRDARINTIGEGANEVLKAFIALVGMRGVGERLKESAEGLKSPSRFAPTLWRMTREHVGRWMRWPHVPVVSPDLKHAATALSVRVGRFADAVEWSLIRHREAILEKEYVQERIADAAIALVTAACTLARFDHQLVNKTATEADQGAATLYLRMANRQFDRALYGLRHNDDARTTVAADAAIRQFAGR
jgi:alkylation response protein AidB-like acyl-CoA dehydrogenase